MTKRNKKGFTIVELVVVIAVIAILSAVLIPTFVNLIHKAEFNNDKALVRNINTTLAISAEGADGEDTMYDTLVEVQKAGYIIENLTPRSSGSDIVWDSEHNQFVLVYKEGNATKTYTGTGFEPNMSKKENLWKIYSEVPAKANQDYSIYLKGEEYNTAVEVVGVGFDAGKNTTIPSVSYTNPGAAQEVTIRTNSATTTLTINAPGDSVAHYGTAGAVNIQEVKTSSYHENGKVAFLEILKGRVVLESTSDVEHIHINKKATEEAFDTVIIEDKGTNNLPKAITRDEVNIDTGSVEVVKVVSKFGQEETVKVYANGTVGTTVKITEGENKQNENVDTTLGLLVLDNGSEAGGKALNANEKLDKKDEVAHEAVSEQIKNSAPEGVTYVARIGMTGYERLDVALAANTVDTTVSLLVDYELPENYEPVELFEGTFDGGNHKIYTAKAVNANLLCKSLTKSTIFKNFTLVETAHLVAIAGDKYDYTSVTFENVDYEALDDTYYQLDHNGSLYTSYCYDYGTSSFSGTVTVKDCDVALNLKGADSSNSAVFFGGYYYAYGNCFLNVLNCSYSGTFIGNYVALVLSNGQNNYTNFNNNLTIEDLKNNGVLIGTNGAYAVGGQNHSGQAREGWSDLYNSVQATTGGVYTIMDSSKLSASLNADGTIKIVDNGVQASSYRVLVYASRKVYNAAGYQYSSNYNFGVTFDVATSGDTNILKCKMVDYETALESNLIEESDCGETWVRINEVSEYQLVTVNETCYYVIRFSTAENGDTYRVELQNTTAQVFAYDADGLIKACYELK